MRSGIYLGPVSTRTPPIAMVLVVVACAGTLFHLAAYLRPRAELETIRSEAARRESEVRAPGAVAATDVDAGVVARLRGASISGVALVRAPTELLQLVQEALPDGVAVSGLTLELASNGPTMVVDAIAREDRDVTTLQQRLAASPPVAATEVLEERVGPDGTLAIRLQVSLAERADPPRESIQ